MFLMGQILIYTPNFLYVYVNTKNIDFKLYLRDIMSGYQLLNRYDEWSILGFKLFKKIQFLFRDQNMEENHHDMSKN